MIPKSSVRETVLYYNPHPAAHTAKLKGVLVQMGVRIKNVTPDQVTMTIEELLGLTPQPDSNSSSECSTNLASGPTPTIDEEMLVMHNFSGNRLDELLAQLRRAKVPRIALKAMVTEHNRGWTFYHLYEEIREEHRQMHSQAENKGE